MAQVSRQRIVAVEARKGEQLIYQPGSTVDTNKSIQRMARGIAIFLRQQRNFTLNTQSGGRHRR